MRDYTSTVIKESLKKNRVRAKVFKNLLDSVSIYLITSIKTQMII